MSRARLILRALPGASRRAGRRLRRLTAAEFLLLLQAPLALPLMALRLRRHGLAAVQARYVRPGAPHDLVRRPDDHERAERISWCVQVAAAYGPWPANCLQRSVVLCWFLRRQRLSGDLRIGVRRIDADRLDFHAWVEHDGVVINDRRDVRQRYATFDRAIVPSSAHFS